MTWRLIFTPPYVDIPELVVVLVATCNGGNDDHQKRCADEDLVALHFVSRGGRRRRRRRIGPRRYSSPRQRMPLMGARAQAWCIHIHEEASLSP